MCAGYFGGDYRRVLDNQVSSEADIKVSDVVWAIRTLNRFIEVREKFMELAKTFSRIGIDISNFDFNNPMSMVQALAMAQGTEIEVDVEMILTDLEKLGDVSLSEVRRAGYIIRRYIGLCNEVDGILKSISKLSGKMGDISAMANMFGLRTRGNLVSKTEVDSEPDVVNISEEEIDEIRKAIEKYKKKHGCKSDNCTKDSTKDGQ